MGNYCTKFGSLKAKGSKDIEQTRSLFLCKEIHCNKFGNFQAKGSKDIEWTLLGLQTNRLTGAKQYASFFQKGGGNNHWFSRFSLTVQRQISG